MKKDTIVHMHLVIQWTSRDKRAKPRTVEIIDQVWTVKIWGGIEDSDDVQLSKEERCADVVKLLEPFVRYKGGCKKVDWNEHETERVD